jgi:hypothetical protein
MGTVSERYRSGGPRCLEGGARTRKGVTRRGSKVVRARERSLPRARFPRFPDNGRGASSVRNPGRGRSVPRNMMNDRAWLQRERIRYESRLATIEFQCQALRARWCEMVASLRRRGGTPDRGLVKQLHRWGAAIKALERRAEREREILRALGEPSDHSARSRGEPGHDNTGRCEAATRVRE